MRVAMFVTALGMGGAEMQVFLLAREMRRRGIDARVFSLLNAPNALAPRFASEGVPLYYLSNGRISLLLSLRRAACLLSEWNPQVIHSHLFHANIFCRVLRLSHHSPVLVSSVHNFYEGGYLRTLAYRWTDKLADLTTNVSARGRRRYIEIRACRAEHTTHIDNCVDTGLFSPNAQRRTRARQGLGLADKFLFLSVGRMQKPKDFATLLYAFEITRKDPEAGGAISLILAGDGPDRSALEHLAKSRGLEDHVRFLGVQQDVASLMDAADCFVLSSQWEGTPLVILEAIASGTSVIATDFSGAHELVTASEGGVVVPRGDAVSLAGAMRDAIIRCPCPTAAHVVPESMGPPAAVDRWLQIYTELMSHGGG